MRDDILYDCYVMQISGFATRGEMYGAVAQLGERLNGIQEADGSIPFSSTNHNMGQAAASCLTFFFHQQAAEKRPSAAFPSSFVVVVPAGICRGLTPQDFGRLASGHF